MVPGITYYYWLEDVNLAGEGTLHGPVTARIEPATVDDPSVLVTSSHPRAWTSLVVDPPLREPETVL